MGYSVVKYSENEGWVKANTSQKNSFSNFEDCLTLCLQLSVTVPDGRFDVSYTPSKRKGKKR
jgi:hypothetical protein